MFTMQKLFLIMLIFLFLVAMGCGVVNRGITFNEKDKRDELNSQVKELEEQILNLEEQIDTLKLNEEIGHKYKLILDRQFELATINVRGLNEEKYLVAIHQTIDFIRAMTTGNKESLRNLLSEEFQFVERDDRLYVVYTYADNKQTEWLLYNPATPFEGMVIRTCSYDKTKNAMTTFTRLFYLDSKGQPMIPEVFLILYIRPADQKIVYLYFDV